MVVDPGFEIKKTFSLDSRSVEIVYSPVNYLSPDKEINCLIDQLWKDICHDAEKNLRKCFDSPGYSVDNFIKKDGCLILGLSDTTYKQYVTTFKNQTLLNQYIEKPLPKLLSVFGFILTSDNYFVLGDNSCLTRSVGQYSAPGGMVQKATKLNSQYLFSEFKREVFEETGIPIDKLVNTKLVAIVIKANTNNTPRLVFSSKTPLLKNDVKRLFSKSDKEYSRLIFVENKKQILGDFSVNPKSNWTIKVLNEINR